MSTVQTVSSKSVEEEVVFYLTSISTTAHVNSVIDWVEDQKPDLTREAIEKIVNDLIKEGRLGTSTYVHLM